MRKVIIAAAAAAIALAPLLVTPVAHADECASLPAQYQPGCRAKFGEPPQADQPPAAPASQAAPQPQNGCTVQGTGPLLQECPLGAPNPPPAAPPPQQPAPEACNSALVNGACIVGNGLGVPLPPVCSQSLCSPPPPLSPPPCSEPGAAGPGSGNCGTIGVRG
jgi:hypothetical protein